MDIFTFALTVVFAGALGMQVFLQNKIDKMRYEERLLKEIAMSHLWEMIFEDHEMMAELARKSKSKSAKESFQKFLVNREDSEEKFIEQIKELLSPKEKAFKVTTKL